MDYSSFGKRVRFARKKKGYTQAKLAELVEYSVQHISHIENGTAKMSMEFVIQLANVLEVSLDELFNESLSFQKQKADETLDVVLNDCDYAETKLICKIALSAKEYLKEYKSLTTYKEGQ